MASGAPARSGVAAAGGRVRARAGPVGRWGLLVTAIALAAALVGTGISAYLAAESSTVPLAKLLAREIVASTRHALHMGDEITPDVLRDVLEDHAQEGVLYVAVTQPDGAAVAAAGEPVTTAWSKVADGDGATPQVELGGGTRVRATGPFIGRGRGAGWRARTGAAPDEPLPWESLSDARIVIEFEPVALQHLRGRVVATLFIGACTAVVLLAAAIVFWRMSLRAEHAAAQLERDRQLKTLGQMSAVLGHELRNPLAGLKGHAQLVLRKLPAEHVARPATETVIREAVRLEQLAEDVLDFARTGEIQPAREDPLAVARGAAEAVGGDRVRIEARPGALPPWHLDRPRMEQVLTNLLRNAVNASSDGEPIELATYLDAETLVYEVRDRGEGLAPGDEDDIFEPFVTRRAKGSGLGLTLARQIVERHGGSIEARNRPGGGAVFRVSIPRREE